MKRKMSVLDFKKYKTEGKNLLMPLLMIIPRPLLSTKAMSKSFYAATAWA